MQKFTKQKKETAIATVLSNKGNCQTQTENFKVSFQYLDTTQKYGSGFKDWQECGLLSKMMENHSDNNRLSCAAQLSGKKGDACAKSYCPLGCLCCSRTYWQQRREYPRRRVQWHSRIYQKEPDNINNCVQREKGSQVLRAILEKASRHDKHSRTSAHLRMPKHKPGNPLHGTDFWWLGEQMEGYFDLTQTFLVWTEDLPKGGSPQKRNRVFHRLRPRRRVVAAMDCDFQTGVLSTLLHFLYISTTLNKICSIFVQIILCICVTLNNSYHPPP